MPGGRFISLLETAESEYLPLEVSLELTRRCNYGCQHCFIGRSRAEAELETARLIEVLEELAELGTLFLTLTGGEPLLRRDWRVVAENASRMGFSLRVQSNGSLVDDETADTLAELAVEVELSLYSTEEAIFDAITGVRGSCKATMEAVHKLHGRGILRALKTPVMRCNLSSLDGVYALARDIDADVVAEPRIFTRDDGTRTPLCHRPPPELLQEFYTRSETAYQDPATIDHQPHDDGPLCSAGVRHAHITADGELLACSMLPRPAGNLRHSGFAEVWFHSPWLAELRQLRRRHLRECVACDRLAYCSRCHGQAMVEDGDLRGPARWSCEHARGLEQAFAEEGASAAASSD